MTMERTRRSLTFKQIERNPDKVTMKIIENYLRLKRKKFVDIDAIQFFEDLSEYNKLYSNLIEQLNRNRDMQVKRVFKEFKKQQYKRRFNVDLGTVVAAIVGEENTFKEIVNFNRETKETIEKGRRLKTYNLLEKIGEKR